MAIPRYSATGWFVDNVADMPIIYLTIIDEGYTTQPGDTPSNTFFRPSILNPESFYIRKRSRFWNIDGHGEKDDAAFGELQLDNRSGAFDFFYRADARDALIRIQLPRAKAYADAGALAGTPAVATAILDTVDGNEILTITLRDTLARNDKLVWCVASAICGLRRCDAQSSGCARGLLQRLGSCRGCRIRNLPTQ